MATRSEYQHGEFSWVNLATKDSATAKQFYGGVFGGSSTTCLPARV